MDEHTDDVEPAVAIEVGQPDRPLEPSRRLWLRDDDPLPGDISIVLNRTTPPFSLDRNLNGVPDECEPSFMPGDCNDDRAADIADAQFVLNWLFLDGPAPEAPFPECGLDPAVEGPDELTCKSFAPCEEP